MLVAEYGGGHRESFRAGAVELVRSSGRTIRDVGRELRVDHETLRSWVERAEQAQAKPAATGGLSADERDELRRCEMDSATRPLYRG